MESKGQSLKFLRISKITIFEKFRKSTALGSSVVPKPSALNHVASQR